MRASTNVAPVIIKRKKVVVAGGHHGGAWKVAYADFVTAMMAFFMLMWLLNATTEKQRKGLADYFAPSVPISRVSGGGDGAFGGTNMFSEAELLEDGTGASQKFPDNKFKTPGEIGSDKTGLDADDKAQFDLVEEALSARSGESMVSEDALKHIVTRVTDEGLIIELFALDGAPLFEEGTNNPTPMFRDLIGMVSRVSRLVTNDMAVEGHIRAHPVVLASNPVWELSTARADRTRSLLEAAGIESKRLQRVTGHADRKPVVRDPMANRNNRIEIILLRSKR
ncbi:flagellar motor protein MotB [Sedimentitalea sp. JM2-8]|uniref:Flagellar motor protein MotB n=1 Tax=Sedimentitalea xiamensis TaxID=3050037 RepID=A0ABT7F8W6_9RHOB|nr:flagellar motor protein MotB [Sedimentitalea xiamensis]MDK3071548.1 flagellar motor protein MotB [Sedimentitalea xiamensis]